MGYMIGVDGGATGTVAILTEEDGTMLSTAHGPASNYYVVGKDGALNAMRQVITEVVEKAGRQLDACNITTFGLSALNNESDANTYKTLIKEIGLGGRIVVENDIVIAWAAATDCKPGAVVIAGTGASAFGVNAADERAKTLGWDYILGDQGSGYWVGLEGIRAAIKIWDGRLPNSPLLDTVLEHFEVSTIEDLITLAYSANFGKREIASFARRVSACAADGDTIAQQILHTAGEELGQAAAAVIRKLNMDDDTFPVGMVGGTFRAGPSLLEPFTQQVRAVAPKAQIAPVRYPAVVGAVILAHHQFGTLTDAVLDELHQTHTEDIRWKTV